MGTFFVSSLLPNSFGEPALNLWLSIAGYTYDINFTLNENCYHRKKQKHKILETYFGGKISLAKLRRSFYGFSTTSCW